MRIFCEMEIAQRHSEQKKKIKLSNCSNAVMFIGFLNIQEEVVQKFIEISTSKPIIIREVNWLNTIYLQRMENTKDEFNTRRKKKR
jgi:hypothetical protein